MMPPQRQKPLGPLIPILRTHKTNKDIQSNKELVSTRESKIPSFKGKQTRSLTKPKPVIIPQISLTLDDFVIGKFIGGGQYGRVYLAKEKRSGFIVALKVIYRAAVAKNTRLLTYLKTEINSQSKLCHENIARLYGYFQDETRLFLIIEYAPGGDFRSFMQRQPHGHFTEVQAAKFTKQIAEGLKAIHGKNIVHRDLKPENILIDAEGNLKIADFGCSVQLEQTAERRTTMIGTIDYMAPEILKEVSYGKNVDVWSLGVMIYEMLVGKTPHYDDNTLKTQQAIKVCKEIEFPGHLNLSDDVKDLITKIMKPVERLSVTDILKHPFITKHTT